VTSLVGWSLVVMRVHCGQMVHPRPIVTINTKKTLEVLSLLRPIVHDTSKTAKITWFILVLHWAVDVIEVLYYIHGPVEY